MPAIRSWGFLSANQGVGGADGGAGASKTNLSPSFTRRTGPMSPRKALMFQTAVPSASSTNSVSKSPKQPASAKPASPSSTTVPSSILSGSGRKNSRPGGMGLRPFTRMSIYGPPDRSESWPQDTLFCEKNQI